MEKYVLLERDGVINAVQDSPIVSLDKFWLLPFVQEAFYEFEQNNFNTIVLCNDLGLGEGTLDLKTLNDMHNTMRSMIAETGGRVHDVMICPIKPDQDSDGKFPNTGLISQAANKYGFEPSSTFMICAQLTSLQAAWKAGCKSAFVKTGKPYKTIQYLKSSPKGPEIFAQDLLTIAVKIVKEYQN